MTAAQIGNLNVRMGIDTAEFSNGVRAVQGSLGGLANSLKAFAGIAAGALSVQTITQQLGSAITRVDELGEAAEKVGMSAEAFSKLEYAARVAGVGMDSLTTTIARFTRQIVDVSEGVENDASSALRKLGISAVDLQGNLRPTEDIITDVAAAFASMPDSANKTATAIALFGRSGAEMIPFLNGGREAIKAMSAEAERFGLVVDTQSARAAAKFNDDLTRLQGASEGLQRHIATALLPTLADLAEAMLGIAEQWSSDRPSGASELWNFLTGQPVRDWDIMTGERLGLGAPGKGDFQGKTNLPGNINPGNFNLGKTAVMPVTPAKIAPVIPPNTIDNIYGAGEAVRILQADMAATIPEANALSNAFDGIADSITSSLTYSIQGLISGTVSAKEAFSNMANSISQELSDLSAELLKSGLLRFLSMALSGSGGAGISIGGSMFGGLFANGGTLGAGKWGIAGEAGPEIIHGPAKITPMGAGGGATSVSWSPSITINGNADQRQISAVMAAEREKFKADLPKMIRDARKRGSI